MRWTARVGDRLHQVELTRGAGGAVSASVDGRGYTLSLTEPQPRVYSILCEGASYEAIVHVRPGGCRVRIGSLVFDVVAGEAVRVDLRAQVGLGGRAFVRAVMPGRVLRVMVKPGQAVAARQGLLVLEAMKMENELAAPRDGVVREVKVQPGTTVETGDLLVAIE